MNNTKKQLKQLFIKNFSSDYGYVESELLYQINTILFEIKKAKKLSKVEFYDKTRWLKKESRKAFVNYLVEQEGLKVKKERGPRRDPITKELKIPAYSRRPTTFYYL